MRRIAVVTTSRADYGLLRPVLRRLSTTPGVEVQLVVSGSHLSPAFGLTVREIEADGRPIADRVEVLLASDSPEGVTKTMGLACIGLGQSLARLRPDILVVLGDRFEMHAAALAALPFLIPVAHIHGGESTLGAFDDCLRHSMTKLSHLHFVAAEEYARRVIQLGEELWRVTVSGSPGLDNLADWEPTPVTELEGQVGMPLPCHGFLLAAFHPVTLEQGRSGAYAEELVAALARTSMPVLVSLPNADPSGREVRVRLLAAVALRPGWCAVENLGTRSFFSVMARAAAMVGNSSSGLIEAPSFGLPVVNIGRRQEGRVRGANVIDTAPEEGAIRAALERALEPSFRAAIQGQPNPYGDGHASERIAQRLASEELGDRLVKKRFHEVRQGGA